MKGVDRQTVLIELKKALKMRSMLSEKDCGRWYKLCMIQKRIVKEAVRLIEKDC